MPENAENPEQAEPVEQAEQAEQAEPRVRTLDARSLRGLAHPLRMRMLALLRQEGPATASQLADRLGESSGSTSYHLRQLAAHGFVEDAPVHGKGRERWWQAAAEGTRFDESMMYDADSEARGAAEVFLRELATIHAQEVNTWLGEAHEWPAAWRRSTDLSDFTLRLSPEQGQELIREMHELVNRYRDLPSAQGTETFRVHTHAFPRGAAK